MLHAVGRPAFGLDLRGAPPQLVRAGQGPLLERAIGVIYLPQTERWSHYFEACVTSSCMHARSCMTLVCVQLLAANALAAGPVKVCAAASQTQTIADLTEVSVLQSA